MPRALWFKGGPGIRTRKITIKSRPRRGRIYNLRNAYTFTRRHRLGIGAYAPRYFKIKDGPADITSNGSGVINSSWTDNPSNYTDWTSIGTLFDSYRVTAIKINYYPALPNDESTQTNYLPLYVVGDVDNTTAGTVPSADVAIQYENVQIKNMYKPWSYFMRIPKRTSIPGGGIVLQGGYLDIGDAAAFGAIIWYGDGFTADTKYGTLIGTAYVKAKNRR